MGAPCNRYYAFGLHMISALRLPDLPPPAHCTGGTHDLAIRIGPVRWPDITRREPHFRIGNDEAILTVHNVARYRIRSGNEIMVDPLPGSSERQVRLFLHGSAFGVLCHQRGLLPLHANAIVANGRAIAFAGRSGAGKSMLAAHFCVRGYDVLGDDVCVLSCDAAGRPLAWRGLPRLKLWRDAAEFFGHDCDTLERVLDGRDKYHVATAPATAAASFPLARIYVLGEQPARSRCRIAPLAGSSALDALMSNTYRGEYLKPMGLMQQHFARCLAVLNHVPIYAAPCRRGFDVLEDEAAKLERHFRRQVASAPAKLGQMHGVKL
jgi:hypothetical protein